MMLKISTAPHLSANQSTQSIMQDVILALMPALIVAIVLFGIGAVKVILTAVAGCILCEYLICRYLMKQETTTNDCSAIVTGLLLAFNLPSNMPLWMILIGCFVAIGVSKMVFGGLGKNVFNPALVGRVFLFISFPIAMTSWVVPDIFNFMNIDMTTSATTLAVMKKAIDTNVLPPLWQLFIGYKGGCIGEVSVLALLLGFIYLLWRRIIGWHIPVYFVGTVFFITGIFYLITGNIRYEPITHILSGGLMLGAIFMATDYVTTPMSRSGQIVFAILCGALTVVIRLFGPYPEGVSFAILIMNAFTPLIDKFITPRVFGKGRFK